MTSAEIRASFLDFFKSKGHTIVPSSSLLPESPNLLFTNAGMNQFVPIFLGQIECPYTPGRAADTQKCIRAGGKHNDLDDVGLDTYHHTFFEMLGNWSFGDYFKKEAIDWAWELVVGRWGFPPQRLYATIYQPGEGDPAERDEAAWDFWAEKFRAAGLDPDVHIVNGDKADNFWMMGETGPCGPCSELHVDLTPAGDTRGALVNKGTAECIEIWNLVFIQFNAQPGERGLPARTSEHPARAQDDAGRMPADAARMAALPIEFVPLAQQHVDTGMGFERVTAIIQGTKGFADFANAKISNYETDIFRPIFDEIEKLSGKKYASTLPVAGSTGGTEQEKIDVAFRVIADHIRTLSFAIADGIQPGNTDRNYVLRRILRRAVRYGRTLGLHEPFFHKLVDVLARAMGGVFPELRASQAHIEATLKREEEAFNRTLDKGIALFEEEAARLLGSAGILPASGGFQPPPAPGARYWKRRLPHYERPHGIYHVTFSTREHRVLIPSSRDAVLSALRHFDGSRYELYAVCVMPDHVHMILQPLVKSGDAAGNPIFYGLSEILHSLKSFSANRVNEIEHTPGVQVWEAEYHDRLMRSDADVEEKFHYALSNPWRSGIVGGDESYDWIWWRGAGVAREAGGAGKGSRQDAGNGGQDARAPQISGAFAFRLYDEQGFPLDLTELMARERGLAVDVAGFEKLMDAQRARARAAQKKQVIELSEIETKEPTKFAGYDTLSTPARVLEVVALKDRTAVILDASTCYAEMGGQVGDTGELTHGADVWRIVNTQKSGGTWLHFLGGADDAPAVGSEVTLLVDPARRGAIQRHHTVTHLLHWALHEVVGKDATQKGSYVGPDKLTFDFSSAALTPAQVREVERLVNERIVENAAVSWTEVPYAGVRGRGDIMQFFGDKYGDAVRVVQIGGSPAALDGYSMELCAGTHVRATGEIGLFRIVSEAAIAAGVRRIEAVAGLESYDRAAAESDRLKALAARLNAPLAELEKKLDAALAHQKTLEKQLAALKQRQAGATAAELLEKVRSAGLRAPAIIEALDEADGDYLQAVADRLKPRFEGVVVLAGVANGAVAFVATVSPQFTKDVQAGRLIQGIAPIVGGKGGGRPDNARGGGHDAAKVPEALREAERLLAG